MDALKKIILAIIYLFAAFGFVAVVNHNTAYAERLIPDPTYRVGVYELENKKTGEETTILFLQGDIAEGISTDVEALLTMFNVDEAVLYSPGGLGYEGYKLGSIFSERRVKTRVPAGAYCLSACAIAYVGGDGHHLDGGVLGFHKAWIPEGAYDDVNEAFSDGQTSGQYHVYYLLANGYSLELPGDIDSLTDSSTFIAFTKLNELEEYYVRTDKNNINDYLESIDIDPKVWGEKEISSHIQNVETNDDWKIKNILSEISK